jgi:uncharacterized glyoxalase superfamily protein PhnB
MPDERPVFDQINLVVRDMDAAVAFYRVLGVDIPDTAPEWQPHHRSARTQPSDFDLDSAQFARMWNEGSRGTPVIGFRLPTREAVDATYERIVAAGYRPQQPPYDAFWGSRYAVVEDPDGNAVGLMSPRDDAFRTEAPTP